jgi:hypothetical protein
MNTIINNHFTITISSSPSGDVYYFVVIQPDGLPTSTQRRTLTECWSVVERIMKEWESDHKGK